MINNAMIGSNKFLVVGLAVALVAAVGAVGVLTTVSFVQEADADSCVFNFKGGGPSNPCHFGKGPNSDLVQHFHQP